MSEPVSNDEVEDVLSSIRRLVSDDKRPLQNTSPKPVNGRLMLTPALRVASDNADDGQVSETQIHDQEAFSEPETQTDTNVESRLEEAEPDDTAVAADDHDLYDTYDDKPAEETGAPETIPVSWQEDDLTEDHTSEAFWDDEPEEIDEEIEAAEPEAELEDDPDGVHEEVDEEPFEEPTFEHRSWEADAEDEDRAESSDEDGEEQTRRAEIDPSALTAKIAALETAIGSIRQEWEPDDPGSDAYSGTNGPALEWEDNVELDARGKPIAVEMPLDPDAEVDEIEEVAFDETSIDEAEATDSAKGIDEVSDPEPDLQEVQGAPAEVPDADALVAEEVVEEEPFAEDTAFDEAAFEEYAAQFDGEESQPDESNEASAADRVAVEPEVAGLATGLSSEDAILDEEMLRELVSDIVRAELQGALGERITRNVRKLVRREIHRALAAQELD